MSHSSKKTKKNKNALVTHDSIARWHHKQGWHHKQDQSGSIVCAHTNLKSHAGTVGTGPRWSVPASESDHGLTVTVYSLFTLNR